MRLLLKLLAALLCGLLASTALPPTNHWWLLPIALGIFLELVHRNIAHKLSLGWCFGFGYFIYSVHWIGNAVLVAGQQPWVQTLAIIGIPSLHGLYISLVVFFTFHSGSSRTLSCWLFAINWTTLEIWRSNYLLPFPLQLLGYAACSQPYLAQFASVVGVYGLSFFIILISSVLFVRLRNYSLFTLATLALVCSWGSLRIAEAPPLGEVEGHQLRIRLLSPDFSFYHGGNPQERLGELNLLLDRSNQNNPDVQLTVWPEAVLQAYTADDPLLTAVRKVLVGPGWLILGADLIQSDGKMLHQYNSMLNINPAGEVIEHYDKQLLTPFGEYMPLPRVLPLPQVAYSIGDIKHGKSFELLHVADAALVPLVCYEALFSSFINKFRPQKAVALLNISNDIWFAHQKDDNFATEQIWQSTTMRAIEYGRPLLRAANIGITGMVDKYGRVIATSTDKLGYLDVGISTTIPASTLYMRLLPLWTYLFPSLAVFSHLWATRKRQRAIEIKSSNIE